VNHPARADSRLPRPRVVPRRAKHRELSPENSSLRAALPVHRDRSRHPDPRPADLSPQRPEERLPSSSTTCEADATPDRIHARCQLALPAPGVERRFARARASARKAWPLALSLPDVGVMLPRETSIVARDHRLNGSNRGTRWRCRHDAKKFPMDPAALSKSATRAVTRSTLGAELRQGGAGMAGASRRRARNGAVTWPASHPRTGRLRGQAHRVRAPTSV
jgi:hypothetical protein